MNFLLFFPDLRDIHLTKDVGQLPEYLSKFGFRTSFLYLAPSDLFRGLLYIPTSAFFSLKKRFFVRLYEKLESLKINFKLKKLMRSFCIILDNMKKLVELFKWNDVLQLIHLRPENIMFAMLYKFVNPKGVLVLKLDVSDSKEKFKPNFIKWKIWNFLMKTDILTVENRKYMELIKKNYHGRGDLHYITNGHNFDVMPIVKSFDEKSNTVIHVGSIGIYQKGSEIVLNAYNEVASLFPDWNFHFIGKMKKEFFNEVKKSPFLNKQIFCHGFISRAELEKFYNYSKIILVPSRFESFGFVTLESQAYGNTVLGTKIPPTKLLTDNGKNGFLCEIDNNNCFINTLKYMLSNKTLLKKKGEQAKIYVKSNFDWNVIAKKLSFIIKGKINMGKKKKCWRCKTELNEDNVSFYDNLCGGCYNELKYF